MSAQNQSYSPGERLAMEFTEDIVANVFATYAGDLCTVGDIPAGITEVAYSDGDFGSVIASGTALLKIATSIAAGTELTPNASGLGIAATTGKYVGAIARFAGVTNQLIEVELTKYIK